MASPSSLLGSSEEATPTRVTPSMSFSAVTKPATDSWPAAQPSSSSEGPTIDPLRPDPPSPPAVLPEAAASSCGQPDVVRQDQREFPHHPLPVEAAVGEAGDRRHPLFVQGLELDVGGEAPRFDLGGGVFALQLGDFVFAFGDLVAGQDQQRHPGENGDEGADEDVGNRPGAHRRVGALAHAPAG